MQNGYLYYTCPTCKAQSQSEALWSKGHDWDADHVCKVCHFHGIDIANAEFSVGGNFKYTGKPIPAAFTLTYQGRTLNVRSDRYGTDGYSEYSNNVDVGIGDVRIDGRGDFYGSKFGHFTIVPESVSEVTMTQEAGHKITLSWKPALGAGYYEVVIPDETIANKYTVLGKTEDTTFTTDQFKVGDAYKLRVASRTLVGDTIYYCSFWSNTIEGIIEHEWGEPEVGSVLPTCDKPGSVNRTCELCGEHEDNAEIPPLGHKVETWTTTVEPTYSSVGQKTGECTVCHQTVTEEIPRLQYTGSGGSTAPGTHQETVTNPDGSKTTTTTKPDGSKTETTTMPDGTVTEKDTAKDGSVTERTTTPEGVTGQVDTNSKGDVTSAEVVIPKEAENQDVVTAPVEVPASKNAADAPEITVTEYGPGTVAVVVNPDGTEEIVRDCVIGENGVVLNVEGDITLKIVDNTETFTDVEPVHHWATDAVEFVAARELFRGTGNHEFTPNGEMTRGMLVTVLYRLAYEPEAAMDDFTDVDPDAYYADAVSWAGRNGIVTGYSDTEFGPNDDVTREQLVTILYRYAEKNGYLTGQSGSLNGYADADNVSDWAAEAMGWAVEIGLVKGVDANHLAPSADATRAEVATIMMRFCEAIIK